LPNSGGASQHETAVKHEERESVPVVYDTHATRLVEQTSLGRAGARALRTRAGTDQVARVLSAVGRLPSNAWGARTKVLNVDDHDIIRKGLRHAFERDRQFEVVGEAATAAEAMRQAGALQPDVVIMDLRLPDGSGLEVTRALRKTSSTMGIVVLTMYAGDDQLFGALEAGASAFVPKTAPADEVVAAARHAASAPSAFTAADLAEAMKRRLAPTGPQLSPREGQVLRLLADGMSVPGIAKQLFVSESTAKTHISKLFEKLGAANRAQALMTALRLGLLEAPDAPKF
jgi:DNA-binding NarL/FixJ family response regulator